MYFFSLGVKGLNLGESAVNLKELYSSVVHLSSPHKLLDFLVTNLCQLGQECRWQGFAF